MSITQLSSLRIVANKDNRKVVIIGPNAEGNYGGGIMIGVGERQWCILSTEDRCPFKDEATARQYLEDFMAGCDERASEDMKVVLTLLEPGEVEALKAINAAAG